MDSQQQSAKQDHVAKKQQVPEIDDRQAGLEPIDNVTDFTSPNGSAPPQTPQQILQMQRLMGNRVVQNLLIDRKQAPAENTSPAFPWMVQGNALISEINRTDAATHPIQAMSTGHTHIQRHPPGNDHGADEPQASGATFEEAVQQHDQDRQTLLQYVNEGKSLADGQNELDATQLRLANSCEWILDGRTKLFVLTPTHDSTERVEGQNKDPNKETAYFPKPGDSESGDISDAAVQYNKDDVNDMSHVRIASKGTLGAQATGYIWMANISSQSKAAVWETIRHETQHDADKSGDKGKQAWDADFKEGFDEAWKLGLRDDELSEYLALVKWRENAEKYKTEYRAYSYEGNASYDNKSNDPNDSESHHGYDWTPRQYAIFTHLQGYDYVPEQWGTAQNGQLLTKDETETKANDSQLDAKEKRKYQSHLKFQQAVVAYVNPDSEGFNKWNSIRVDDFYKALNAIPDNTDVGDPAALGQNLDEPKQKVKKLVDTIGNLKHDEAQYILNDSPDYTKLMQTKLSNDTLTGIKTMLGNV